LGQCYDKLKTGFEKKRNRTEEEEDQRYHREDDRRWEYVKVKKWRRGDLVDLVDVIVVVIVDIVRVIVVIVQPADVSPLHTHDL
jgi:hypothetical protein